MSSHSPMKPGIKTTEFWLSLLAMLVTALYASGLIGEGGTVAKVASFVALVLTSLGYTVSRSLAKSSSPTPPGA